MLTINCSTQMPNFVLSFFFFSLSPFSFFFFNCRDGFACHCLHGWWRERQRNGNCTWRPGYGSVRSVSWRLCWQKKPSPGIPKDVLGSSRRVSLVSLVLCSLQTGFMMHGRNSFSHSTHSLCGYTCHTAVSEMFGVCLHYRVFWGMKNMVIAMANNLCGDFQTGVLVAVCQ